jgi:UDP-N-acetylglucosamine:LPS N-acetylglucosamine transferase
MVKEEKIMKVCFITSSGGHLTHLIQLKEWWKDKERFWVTFEKEDSKSILKDEKKYWCYFPTNRNIKNLFKNTFLSIKILLKEKPDLIVSTGAAPAIPFFYIGKLFGAKVVYIEVYDRIEKPTITGKVVYPISDLFILQWEEQKKFYPRGQVLEGLF